MDHFSLTAKNIHNSRIDQGYGNPNVIAKTSTYSGETYIDLTPPITLWISDVTITSTGFSVVWNTLLQANSLSDLQDVDLSGILDNYTLKYNSSTGYFYASLVSLSETVEDSNHRLVTDSEKSTWNGKQDLLVSGLNIKTINSTSLLGNTDIALAPALGTNDNYVTDAEKTILSNTSNTNTGDETKQSIETKLGAAATDNNGYLSSGDWDTFNSKEPTTSWNNLTGEDGLAVSNGIGAIKAIVGVTVGADDTHMIPTLTDESTWNIAAQNVDNVIYVASERNSSGLIEGGTIIPEGGILFTVLSGTGYIVNHTTNISTRVHWLDIHHVASVGDGSNFFYIDINGNAHASLVYPDRNTSIYIGACYATQGNTVIISVQNNPEYVDNFQERVHAIVGDSIKPIVNSGCEVTSPTSLGINIANGVLNMRLQLYNFAMVGDIQCAFLTSDYGFVTDVFNWYSPAGKINTTHWNDITKPYGLSVVEMTEGYWKKDLIALFNNGATFCVYGQTEYLTESLAKQAPIQYIPDIISQAAVYLAFVISKKGDTDISNRIIDIRPNFSRVWGQLGNDADSKPANASINMMSSGLLSGGLLSINTNPTKFNLSGGNAIVVDNTDVLNPTYITLNWKSSTGMIDPLLTTCDTTYINMNSSETLVFSSTGLTSAERRDYVAIGWLDHPDRANISFAWTEPFYNSGIQSQYNDFIENYGSFNIKGNIYSASSGLQIKRSSGKVFDGNANYAVSSKDPHIVTNLVGEDPCLIYYSHRTNLTGDWQNDLPPVSYIDPNNYDDGSGSPIPVPSGKWTIQVVTYYAIYEANDIQYGQKIYASCSEALGNLYDIIYLNPYNTDDILRAWLVVKQGATDLTDIAQANFITAGRVRLNDILGGITGEGIEEIVSVNSLVDETAAFEAGAKIVIREDLI